MNENEREKRRRVVPSTALLTDSTPERQSSMEGVTVCTLYREVYSRSMPAVCHKRRERFEVREGAYMLFSDLAFVCAVLQVV